MNTKHHAWRMSRLSKNTMNIVPKSHFQTESNPSRSPTNAAG
ncbi:Uncharacterised protein [Vibrio cholerae]|nr:Uncharacterised protein [Vibrio cholerae]